MNTMGTIYHLILSFAFVSTQLNSDQKDILYKPSDEFEVKVDYSFQERPQEENRAAYEAVEKRSHKPGGPLPYMLVTVTVLKVSAQETRVKAVDSNGKTIANRKANNNTQIEIKWGFSEDIKDRIAPHTHTVLFLDDSKKPVSQIYMLVEEDGTFYVNGEKRGKF
jgi:hypothetical protein